MTIKKRSRIRRILKWMGLGACGLVLAAAWWSSRDDRVPLVYFSPPVTVTIFESRVSVWLYPFPRKHVSPQGWHYGHNFKDGNELSRYGFDSPNIAHMPFRSGGHVLLRSFWTWYIRVPFWLILILVGIPTAYMWRRERRVLKGHCQTCGYNLTGNVSGRCPECGEACKPEAGAQ